MTSRFWTSKTRAVLQLRAAPCFEEQLHPACNRSTVSTGRGASHSTTCIPGGITREHRGDVLQTSRQWLRQDATEFRTQTNVHGAQDQRGLPLISALRSGSTGDPQTSFGSHKFACQRELAPRLNCRSIYPETDQRTGESATSYLGASVRPRVCGGLRIERVRWEGGTSRRGYAIVSKSLGSGRGMTVAFVYRHTKGDAEDAWAQIAHNSWYGGRWTQGPAPSIRQSQAGASIAGAAERHNA